MNAGPATEWGLFVEMVLTCEADADMTHLGWLDKAFNVFEEATLLLIEDNTDRILAEIGVDLKDDPESLDVLAAAGGRVNAQRVKISGSVLREIITASAPNSFVQHARNPQRSILIGKGTPVFAPVYGPPKVRDRDSRLKNGDVMSYQTFVRLAQAAPAIGNTGHMICVLNDV
ncbi:MAG: trimethylamine methyltransferase family protein, partial [Acidiferrobacterales bacterium]